MLQYALTTFLGAFLLFQVQPLIGKYILPWFGGSPGVWTTCLLFFQTLLLGGYAYAHFLSTRLKPKTQLIVHLHMLVLALVLLPITPSESWKALLGGNPTWRILLLLTATVGLPYFVLSSTGPLMQRWFSRTHPGQSPYRLYALSNVGSLLALLSYPFFFEPRFTRHQQGLLWSGGLIAFALLCGTCAWLAYRASRGTPDAVDPQAAAEEPARFGHKVLWVAFPAIASVLLLATTNKLCQDVAVIPFLWILPLSLYLLSFILCFDHPRWYQRGLFSALLIAGVGAVVVLLDKGNTIPLYFQVAGYALTLFVACMVCHGELFALRPAPSQLTQYYLLISAGGALGGLLVAVVAPAVLNHFWELQIGFWMLLYLLGCVCIVLRSRAIAYGTALGALLVAVIGPVFFASTTARRVGWSVALPGAFKTFFTENVALIVFTVLALVGFLLLRPGREWKLRHAGAPMLLSMLAAYVFLGQAKDEASLNLESTRNFYGTLTVAEHNVDNPSLHYYSLTHGSITHGLEFVTSPQSMLPTTYYGLHSGVGLAILNAPVLGGRKLGLVGLGTGSLTAYGSASDKIRIYEINPEVERLARERFKYLDETKAEVTVVLGDARLSMEREVAGGDFQQFDVLALDAFSSDAIPVHLLTKEAFELYLKQITQAGVIAVHISNRYLDLEPVVYKIVNELHLQAVTISDEPSKDDWWLYRSTWILVSRSLESVSAEDIFAAASRPKTIKPNVRLWTDDYASLYPVLKR
jgi:hypothetical protein